MARWGSRAALAVALAASMMLLATTLATSAGADSAKWEKGLLDVDVDYTGEGGEKLAIHVSGCTTGGIVRLSLETGYPTQIAYVGDLIVGESGTVWANVPVNPFDPPDRVAAYCWPTNAFDSVPVPAYLGDPGGGDPCKVLVQAVSTDGGGDPCDDLGGDDGNPCEVFAQASLNTGGGDPCDDQGDGGTDGNTGGGFWDQFDRCKFFRGADLDQLNIVNGNTFIADTNYEFVALWDQLDDISQFDGFYDVQEGQAVTTLSQKPIKKVGLCDPSDKPTYTPGKLIVTAKIFPEFNKLRIVVNGCPAGDEVEIFLDDVYYDTFVVPGNDELIVLIQPAPVPLPETVKAVCENGEFGVTDVDTRLLQPVGTRFSAASEVADSNPPAAKAADVQIVAIESSGFASGDDLDQAIAAVEAAGATYVPLDRGIPEGAGDAGVQLVALSPASELKSIGEAVTGTQPSSSGSPIGVPQMALGVMSGLGLLAFIGLRRVARSDA